LAYQVYQIGNANFACKILIQALWRNQWEFMFHVRFYPNIYNYCGGELQTKYTHGIAIHISIKIPLSQA
jgi:hypothetical protein